MQFLTSKHASGSNTITLNELLKGGGYFYDNPNTSAKEGAFFYVMANAKANAIPMVTGMITIPLAFKMAKSLGRPAISRTNRLLAKAGVASTVKI